MEKIVNKSRKIIIVLIALSIWLYWDLSQAHSTMMTMYKSFFLNSEINAVTTSPATVAIVRSNDSALGADTCSVTSEAITYNTIYKMVKRAVTLAGGLPVKSGDTVLIKPNIVQQDSSGSGGVTDIRVVKALVYLIDSIDHGHIKIIVGDGSPRPYTTFEKASGTTAAAWTQLFDVPGYQLLKIEVLAAGIDFRLSNLNGNSDTNPWQELDTVNVPGGGLAQLQGGKYFIHKDVTHASVYITVPVMKTHQQPGYTGALKNQIGLAACSRYGFNKTTGVTQDGKVHHLDHNNLLASTWHNWQDKEIVDLATIAKIKFVVVDAITCVDSNKTPHYSTDKWNTHISNRIKMNTVMAGYDPVAVDNVCCRVMGLNPDDIEHITLAERMGLGTNNSDNITVVGTSIAQTKRLFRKPQQSSVTTNLGLYGQGNRTWLLSNYYVTSGISNPMDSSFISNEASVAPTAGIGGWSQPIYFTDDQILLNDYYTTLGTQSAVSYAFTYFTAPAAQQAELWVGSDEALKIYLNGAVVYNYSGTRTFTGDEFYKEIVTINLQQGLNRLLVKSYQSVGKYTFSVNICDVEPNILYKGNRVLGLKFLSTSTVNSVKDERAFTISSFELKNNYPNPFNPTTMITYQLSKTSYVRLTVYDITGREVTTLFNGEKPAGSYSIPWNASNISSGVYYYKLTAGNFSQVKKMVLVK
jgi:uncharacterized protein (DUF362 family)